MTIRSMIQFITESIDWTFDVRPDAVVITKTGGTFKGRPMETEFYEVTQGTINRMTGGSTGGMGGPASIPLQFLGGGGGGGGDDTGIKIKQFPEGAGIPFDDTKGHKFVFDGFQMIVTHERRYLDLIERILAKLDQDSSRQVEIETKFLEVQEGAFDELSFDWTMGWGDPYLLARSKRKPINWPRRKSRNSFSLQLIRKYANTCGSTFPHWGIERYGDKCTRRPRGFSRPYPTWFLSFLERSPLVQESTHW